MSLASWICIKIFLKSNLMIQLTRSNHSQEISISSAQLVRSFRCLFSKWTLTYTECVAHPSAILFYSYNKIVSMAVDSLMTSFLCHLFTAAWMTPIISLLWVQWNGTFWDKGTKDPSFLIHKWSLTEKELEPLPSSDKGNEDTPILIYRSNLTERGFEPVSIIYW